MSHAWGHSFDGWGSSWGGDGPLAEDAAQNYYGRGRKGADEEITPEIVESAYELVRIARESKATILAPAVAPSAPPPRAKPVAAKVSALMLAALIDDD
jgi:hypothetical protein